MNHMTGQKTDHFTIKEQYPRSNFQFSILNLSVFSFLKSNIHFGLNEASSEHVTPLPPVISNDSPTCGDGNHSVTFTATNVVPGDIVRWYDVTNTEIGTGVNFTINNVTSANAGVYFARAESGGQLSSFSNLVALV